MKLIYYSSNKRESYPLNGGKTYPDYLLIYISDGTRFGKVVFNDIIFTIKFRTFNSMLLIAPQLSEIHKLLTK